MPCMKARAIIATDTCSSMPETISQEDILSNRYYRDIRTHGTASQIAWGMVGDTNQEISRNVFV